MKNISEKSNTIGVTLLLIAIGLFLFVSMTDAHTIADFR